MSKHRIAFWHAALLAVGLSAILARSAAANPIRVSLGASGNGSIDGIPFTDALLSINTRFDSDDWQPLLHADGFTANNVFAVLSINSLPGGTTLLFGRFDIPTRIFVNNDVAVAGFGHATGLGTIADGVDLFHVEDARLATWRPNEDDLLLVFDDAHGQLLSWTVASVVVGGHTVVFDTAPTPGRFFVSAAEPTTLLLLGTGVAAAALWRRSKTRATNADCSARDETMK